MMGCVAVLTKSAKAPAGVADMSRQPPPSRALRQKPGCLQEQLVGVCLSASEAQGAMYARTHPASGAGSAHAVRLYV